MTAPATAATAPASAPAAVTDTRRITEHDPALARLKWRTIRQLTASVRQFARELRSGEQPGQAQSHFIERHTAILRAAYRQAHREGQRDYYGAVSREPGRWAHQEPDAMLVARRMAFYAPSVARMAYEAVQALNASDLAVARVQRHSEQSASVKLAGGIGEREDNLATWQSNLGARITLQADLTWSGGQDGYVAAGWADSANPYGSLWWDLEPMAQHCDDCPLLAAGSPYDPPWIAGGNTLATTPGDGNTACGAGCKCSLRYGGAGSAGAAQPTQDMKAWLPDGTPGVPEGDTPMVPTPLPPPPPASRSRSGGSPAIPGGEFNSGQKKALDLYRLAELQWNAVRGPLPELPNFFTLANPDFEWPRLEWNALSPQQQHALELALEAFATWQANVPSDWFDY